jgi:hypothetical protein
MRFQTEAIVEKAATSLLSPTNLKSGKVDHAINLGMFHEHLVEQGLVGDIYLHKRWPLPADQFDPIENLFR